MKASWHVCRGTKEEEKNEEEIEETENEEEKKNEEEIQENENEEETEEQEEIEENEEENEDTHAARKEAQEVHQPGLTELAGVFVRARERESCC